MEKRLLKIEEAAEYLGTTKGSLYKMVWQKRLPFVVRMGTALRFDRMGMEKWIEENTQKVKNY